MVYCVETMDDGADEEAVFRVWRENLPLDSAAGAKHRWYYRDNPWGRGTLFLLRHSPAEGGSAVVGTLGMGPRRFRYGGATLPATLIADLAVEKAHRSGAPALQLGRAVCRRARATAGLAYGFPNVGSVAAFQRFGYRSLGPMPTYARVLRYAARVERRLRSPVAAAALGNLLDVPSRLRVALRQRRRGRELELEWRRDVDLRVDDLARRAEDPRELRGLRSVEFLRWRFAEKPGQDAEFASLVDRRRDELVAYAVVVRAAPDVAFLPDLLAASEADLGALLDTLSLALRARGLASVRVDFLGRPTVVATLKAHGFVARAARSVLIDAQGTLPEGLAQLPPAERWFLTQADEDN